ncbi:putative rta1 domain protein [Neofusicoccum parvum UCRNP2]|uniref:Putative rta1 domain protein n=1 Tax=Botryosphaeria parva (strain UCR-NP2) TaxID=1287680 RepID=R1G438_BOTPV|nr:putative rta1 domain protein [Neofusicoccum parvum UCRNP2]
MSNYVEGSMWYYAPSKVAPIIFMILFLLSGLAHLYQTIHYKTWRITVFLPWAALIMSAGFALRLAGAYHIEDLGIVIASQVLVMSGPPIYAASNYLVLSRVLFYVPYLSPMHPGRVLTTFLGLDIIIEALVANGAVRVTNTSLTPGQRKAGDVMVKVSLIAQALVFIALLFLATQFHVRARRARVLTRPLRTVLIVLYTTSAAVFIRCIYRIVEYFEGYEGVLLTHEFYFYIFEAALMLVTTLILNSWHPGKRLPRSNTVFLAQDGVTERRGLGWGDNRPWPVTLADPFDIAGLCRGRDKKTRFWEMTDAEIEAVEAERKASERPAWKVAMDPFGVYGRDGKMARLVRGGKGRSRRGAGGVDAVYPKRSVENAV